MKNSHIILLACLATFGVYATGNTPLSINITPEMMQAANKANEQSIQHLNSEQNKVARQFAANIAELSKSEEFKARQKAVSSQVLSAAGLQKTPEKEDGPRLAGNQLVMFVSSSMPLVTLRKYAHDLAKVGGVMVMRGTVGGISKMVETTTLTRNILVADPSCTGAKCKMWGTEMLIDPMLFRIYGVNKVPALIYQPDMHIQSYCDGLEGVNKASTIVYGDASVRALLERINTIQPDEKIKKIITKLEVF
ncbi:conjugal transfer protein TrbC [Citrobacter freundii]|nr:MULTISPECIES: type-F conjugative transfer system pilin assembly protein TrbC [Gammaproteobacteria]EEA2350413.1 conjugal transfer protein TrbC [Salmonella enterica subsp. enterica serovar Enteritidis]EEC4304191.1 conjugal transfer protein TrbC [Salmonella enterica subsp. enterica serovar Enteritidis]EEN2406615.1 conjugal transfer protein TrbC [Salmonella enterica subsp. enterica serovar Enteritidis]EES8921231.1 conjugal transfer protein TrbC [Escherichia coli]EES9863012.1 conjugal transfer p